MTIQQIEQIIRDIEFISIASPFQSDKNGFITGEIGIHIDGMPSQLIFQTKISPHYPNKSFGIEPIHFYNKSLIEYSHIMEDGAICSHLTPCRDYGNRLKNDLLMLKKWVEKYYINGEKDQNYEHIIIEYSLVDDIYYALHFSQLENRPMNGEYGYASVTNIREGSHNGKIVKNMLLQHIIKAGGKIINKCQWSKNYMGLSSYSYPYIFLSSAPCTHNKFGLKAYDELNAYLTEEQIHFIHQYEKALCEKKFKGLKVPLLIGYPLPNNNIHWIASILTIGSFPTEGYPERINGTKTGKWLAKFYQEKIDWAMSYDSSHKLFFGRGAFDKAFIDKKILIIGVGAVGSILAKTLARCGCMKLSVFDYDIKKPENICRSEYEFITGVIDKTLELSNLLSAINPHIEVEILKEEFECFIKANDKGLCDIAKKILDSYDIIFDCSTDNDLMEILEELSPSSDIVNISITNHASELVCGFSPNITQFVKTAFDSILKNDLTDLYNPTGCWSPTFKASYNDIALMVQYAINHIHKMLINEEAKQNFILKDTEQGLKITKY